MASYSKRQRQTPEYESESSLVRRLKTETKYQLEKTSDDFFSQLLGFDSDGSKEPQKKTPGKDKSNSNESIVFQVFNGHEDKAVVNKHAEIKRSKSETGVEPGIRYHQEYYESIARSGENFSRRETREIKEQVRQIMSEIKKLASSSKELQVEFGQITVQEAPENPGKYYSSFFDWLLIMLRQARQKVEDSKAWLDTVKSKSKKKSGYWEKSKKHGTSFSQSNERTVATSTG